MIVVGRVRYFTFAASVVAVLLAGQSKSQAQWMRCGPQGGAVTSFAVLGSRILAGTEGNVYNQTPGSGIFVSLDSGVTWAQTNAGLTDTTVYTLGVSGNYVLASTASGNLFRSSDRGASWNVLASPSTSQPISSFATIGNYLFAVTGNDGVLRSTDNGTSWQQERVGFGVLDIHTIAVMDTVLFANGSWTDGGGIYRSTDYGATWSDVYNSAFDIAVLGNRIFAAMYHTVSLAMSVSTDEGATWTQTGEGGCGVYNQMATAGSVVFSFHSQNGVFYSLDSGADWTASNAIRDFYCVAAMGNTLFIGNETGVLRSTDLGGSWDTSITGMYIFEPSILTQPYTFVTVGHTIIASCYQNGIRSNDGGAHWIVDTFSNNSENKEYAMGNILLAPRESLYRSDDFGISWHTVDNDYFFDPFLVAGSTLFANIDYPDENTTKLMRSTDTGKTWTDVGGALDPGQGGFIDNLTLASDGYTVYAATGGPLYCSTDLGNTWKDLTGGLIDAPATAITAQGPNICVDVFGANYYMDGGSRLFRSTDAGVSWTATDLNFTINSFLRSGNNVLAASTKGIYLSTDNGISWGLAMNGMSPDTNAAFAFGMIDSTVYASTANGIWKEQRSEIPFIVQPAGVQEIAAISDITLSPNPTAGMVTIEGSVRSIEITNLLGETVLPSPLPLPREQGVITLDISKLAAGAYFARITAGDGQMTMRKIVKE